MPVDALHSAHIRTRANSRSQYHRKLVSSLTTVKHPSPLAREIYVEDTYDQDEDDEGDGEGDEDECDR